jgi:YD repeat-containing protein
MTGASVVLAVLLAIAVVAGAVSASVLAGAGRRQRALATSLREELVQARRETTEVQAARSVQAELERAKAEVAGLRESQQRQAAATAAAVEAARAQAVATARAELEADQRAAAEAVRAEVGAGSAATWSALWTLACQQQQRAADLIGRGLPRTQSPSFLAALGAELERIREETGTPGALAATELGELSPTTALVALRATQALLAILTRYCQAYDVAVDRRQSRIALIVSCEGWEGPDRAAEDIGNLLAVLAPAGGDLELERDEQGRLVALLTLPDGQIH